jgi:hypothetical protein
LLRNRLPIAWQGIGVIVASAFAGTEHFETAINPALAFMRS